MKEAGPTKTPPRRSRLGARMAELLGCTLVLFLLCWSTWDVQVPSLCSRGSAARAAAAGGGGGWRRHRWVLVDGTEPAAASPPAACTLDVEQGPIAEACHLISDACVDQQMVVLYGKEYFRPLGAPSAPTALPLLEPSHRHSHFRYAHKGTGANVYQSLPPLQFRAASAEEPTPYLQEPVFSSCTVPVIYYSHYLVNPAHMFRDNAAILFGALNESSWGEHAKVVVMTSLGLPMPRFTAQVMQAVALNVAVETWAEFSSRLPSQQTPAGGYLPTAVLRDDPGAPRASWEGGPQRCFRHMYVCTNGVNGVNSTDSWPLHAFGQRLVKHHLGSLPAKARPLVRAQPPVALQRRLRLASDAAADGKSVTEPAVLNILFHRRGINRMLLNAAELLDCCNAWSYTTAAGVPVRAQCSEVELTDLSAGIMAAQRADIFIGAHGANMANGWLMRPGSSVLELTMHQFEEGFPHEQYAKRNMRDADTQVQYWKVLLCDERHYPPGSWTPSPREQEGQAAGTQWHPSWPKFRNLAVRWEVIDMALREIVETGGDMHEYKKRWDEGRWWWLSGANQTVYAGTDLRQTCRRARALGLVS